MFTRRDTYATAQVTRDDVAYIATTGPRPNSRNRRTRNVATLWRTCDAGGSWTIVPWRRPLRSLMSRRTLRAHWPPEWINTMWLSGDVLFAEIIEPSSIDDELSDPVWRASWDGRRWDLRFDREARRHDGHATPPPISVELPGFASAPRFGPFR